MNEANGRTEKDQDAGNRQGRMVGHLYRRSPQSASNQNPTGAVCLKYGERPKLNDFKPLAGVRACSILSMIQYWNVQVTLDSSQGRIVQQVPSSHVALQMSHPISIPILVNDWSEFTQSDRNAYSCSF